MLLIAQRETTRLRREEGFGNTDVAAARSTVNENSTDLGLLDVSGLRLDELLAEPDDSAFRRALDRILSPSSASACNGFQANI